MSGQTNCTLTRFLFSHFALNLEQETVPVLIKLITNSKLKLPHKRKESSHFYRSPLHSLSLTLSLSLFSYRLHQTKHSWIDACQVNEIHRIRILETLPTLKVSKNCFFFLKGLEAVLVSCLSKTTLSLFLVSKLQILPEWERCFLSLTT